MRNKLAVLLLGFAGMALGQGITPGGGGGGLGSVTLTGTPTIGQQPTATGTTTATWQLPPIIFTAAECVNSLASTYVFSLPGTNSPIPTCVTGTNQIYGALNFAAQPASAQYAYGRTLYLGPIASVIVSATTTGITGTVGWGVQFACVDNGAVMDVAWNTATTNTATVPGTTLQRFSITLSSPTQTGCSTVGSEMLFRINRLTNDTTTTVAQMTSVRFQ